MKSTPINQLPGLTSPPSQQIDGPNMVGNPAVREQTQTSPQSALVRSEDMVNEILNEIDAVNVENNRNVENTSALERQIDPNVNAQLGTPSREQVEQMTQEQVVSPLPSHTVPEVDQTPTPSSVSPISIAVRNSSTGVSVPDALPDSMTWRSSPSTPCHRSDRAL